MVFILVQGTMSHRPLTNASSLKITAAYSARPIKSCIRPAVRQGVLTDVQITIRRELQFFWCSDIRQSFAPIGLHKTDAASDWLLIKLHFIGKKSLLEV
jgi:hypothetical protein